MNVDREFHPVAGDAPVEPTRILTLADVHAGDTLEMGVVPEPVREVLAGFGVHEGARVRCESARNYVVVRTEAGCVPFERGLAASVPVTRIAEGESPAGAS